MVLLQHRHCASSNGGEHHFFLSILFPWIPGRWSTLPAGRFKMDSGCVCVSYLRARVKGDLDCAHLNNEPSFSSNLPPPFFVSLAPGLPGVVWPCRCLSSSAFTFYALDWWQVSRGKQPTKRPSQAHFKIQHKGFVWLCVCERERGERAHVLC